MLKANTGRKENVTLGFPLLIENVEYLNVCVEPGVYFVGLNNRYPVFEQV